MNLTSSAFVEGKDIPAQYTCQGKDISPSLKWSGVPANAKSLALIADDPDAPMGTWVHWVLYSLPPTTTELAENVEKSQSLPVGTKQGVNDFRRLGTVGRVRLPASRIATISNSTRSTTGSTSSRVRRSRSWKPR